MAIGERIRFICNLRGMTQKYYYPQYDDTQITARVPSLELSNAMVKALKGNIKE